MRFIFSLIISMLILFSCSYDDKCNGFEKKIKECCFELDTVYSFKINNFIDSDWEELFIITGPRFPIEVEEIIGISYNEFIKDDEKCYLFVKDGIIKKQLFSSCKDITLSNWLTEGKGYVKYSNTSLMSAKKYKTGNSYYYTVLQGGG